MEWIYLTLAGIFEIVWAVGLKASVGFSKMIPSTITVFGMIMSFLFLELSLRKIPLGTAYAVWTGIGIIGTVVLGVLFFKETMGIMRFFFIALILMGVIGLRVISIK